MRSTTACPDALPVNTLARSARQCTIANLNTKQPISSDPQRCQAGSDSSADQISDLGAHTCSHGMLNSWSDLHRKKEWSCTLILEPLVPVTDRKAVVHAMSLGLCFFSASRK
jgi:hypothetical protein